jgi:hypothetical protein
MVKSYVPSLKTQIQKPKGLSKYAAQDAGGFDIDGAGSHAGYSRNEESESGARSRRLDRILRQPTPASNAVQFEVTAIQIADILHS